MGPRQQGCGLQDLQNLPEKAGVGNPELIRAFIDHHPAKSDDGKSFVPLNEVSGNKSGSALAWSHALRYYFMPSESEALW